MVNSAILEQKRIFHTVNRRPKKAGSRSRLTEWDWTTRRQQVTLSKANPAYPAQPLDFQPSPLNSPMSQRDFDVDSLASYLHLTPAQVARMADRGKLPGRKIGGQWRFPEAEIHHWLEERIGVSGDEELVQVENVLDRAAPDEDEICIADMLPREAIAVPLNARTRGKVITAMTDLAADTGWLWDPAKMAEAVSARESLHSTALENGVALLHPRRPQPGNLAQAFLALGRTYRGIPFGDSQGRLTDVFFLICSTDDGGHLRTLARLSRLLADPNFLDNIRHADDAEKTHSVIVETEQTLFG
jgi:PTS system nitrogen regulatory IIA component